MFLYQWLLSFFQFLCLLPSNSASNKQFFLIRILLYHLVFIYGCATTTILTINTNSSNNLSRYFIISGNVISLIFMCYAQLCPILYQNRLEPISETTRAYLNHSQTLTILNIIVVICVVLLFNLVTAAIYPLYAKVFYFFTELLSVCTCLIYINHILCLHSKLNEIAMESNPREALNIYNHQIQSFKNIQRVYSVLIWLLLAFCCIWQLHNFFLISVSLLRGNVSEIYPFIIYSITKFAPMLAICIISEIYERKCKEMEIHLSALLQHSSTTLRITENSKNIFKINLGLFYTIMSTFLAYITIYHQFEQH